MPDREKLLREIQRLQLVSCCNNSRWQDVFLQLHELPLKVRIKWLFSEDVYGWGFYILPVSGYIEQGQLGPVLFREIEWLDIDSIHRSRRGALVPDEQVSYFHRVVAILKNCRVDYEEHGEILRIWGYRKCNSSMPSP